MADRSYLFGQYEHQENKLFLIFFKFPLIAVLINNVKPLVLKDFTIVIVTQ